VETKTNAKFGAKAKQAKGPVSARPGSTSATAALRILEHAGVFELYGSRKDGCLRCKYDHKIIGSSTSNVSHHLETAVHINAVASKAREVELNELTVAAFEDHFEQTNQAGGHTEEKTIVFRTDFLRASLDAGVPLAKMDSFRPSLDQYCKFSSTAATNLSKYVPILLKSECTILRAALKGQHVLVILDGTTTVGEIFAIILRWCEAEAINDCINALHASDPLKYPADPDGSLNGIGEAFEQRLRQMITLSWTYYFDKTILGTLAPMLALLKACRLANPYAFARLQPTADEFRAAVESLDHFTAADVLSICGGYGEYARLCSELPALPLHSSSDYEMKSIKSFWRANHATVHNLSPFFVRYCFTIQCSSAAVERVFSVLKNSFCSQQELSLEDYVCLSPMRQFNSRGDL
jgi:hypothetical protein